MLKWLRKYNSIILVVGGVLLMVAFLLPETISQLGKTPIGGSAFKINGKRVSYADADFASREFFVLRSLLGEGFLAGIGGGENSEHWIMLNREAERQGFAGGKSDGIDFLPELARAAVAMQYEQYTRMGLPMQQVEQFIGPMEPKVKQLTEELATRRLPSAMGQARLSEDQAYRALGKLHAITRMRVAYQNAAAARLSGPRMIAGLKEIADSAKADAVFIPPDRAPGEAKEPTAEEMRAHFDRFKGTKPGEGEFGIGYLMPDRVKLAFMTIDRNAIQTGLTPEAVEVRKRFLKQFPTGTPPSEEAAQAAMVKIEDEVRAEQLDRVLKAIDQIVKAEIEKATRKLEADGDYKKLPADWATGGFKMQTLAATVEKRVKETSGTTIALPSVSILDANWLTAKELSAFPGIGESSVKRGNQSESFAEAAMKVRELAGRNQGLLQAGIPSLEYTADPSGNRYYFMVLDARKESAPEAYTEIEDRVKSDVKRLAGFERMKDNLGGYRLLAETAPDAIAALAKTGAATVADELPVLSGLTVRESGISPTNADLDHEDFRKAVLAAAAKLDPLTDLSTQDASARLVITPVAKSLGIGAAKITTVSPMTEERFRSAGPMAGAQLINRMRQAENQTREDPFSLSALETRLNVKYNDNRVKKQADAGKGT